MADTPRSAFPTISEQATVRIKLGLLVSMVAAIIGGTAWLTNIHNDSVQTRESVNEVREWAKSLDRRMGNVEEALGLPRSQRQTFGPERPEKDNR